MTANNPATAPETPHSRHVDPAQFLAVPTPAGEESVHRTSDSGEAAMDKLRHPFTVEANPAR
jgi:hypothetical protein